MSQFTDKRTSCPACKGVGIKIDEYQLLRNGGKTTIDVYSCLSCDLTFEKYASSRLKKIAITAVSVDCLEHLHRQGIS